MSTNPIQKKIEEEFEKKFIYSEEDNKLLSVSAVSYGSVKPRATHVDIKRFLKKALQDIYNQGREDERRDNRKDLTIKDQDKWYRAGWKDGEREIREKFIKEINELVEALIWCSGSGDFQLEGKARKGWEKICKPLIEKYKKVH